MIPMLAFGFIGFGIAACVAVSGVIAVYAGLNTLSRDEGWEIGSQLLLIGGALCAIAFFAAEYLSRAVAL